MHPSHEVDENRDPVYVHSHQMFFEIADTIKCTDGQLFVHSRVDYTLLVVT